MRRRVVILGLLLLAPAFAAAQGGGADDPSSSSEATDITFYGHVFGHGRGAPMPANTEAPIGEELYALGSLGQCGGPANELGDCREATWNELILFSTPGFVQVGSQASWDQGGGYAQIHNERGQTTPISLSEDGEITATVYMSWDTHGWLVQFLNPYGTNCVGPHPQNMPCMYPSWGWDPGVYPGVTIETTLYQARLGAQGSNASAAPPVADAINDGSAEVVAQGQWGPDQVINGLPGYPNVNAFDINLGSPQTDTIDRDKDFFLRFNAWHNGDTQPTMLNGPPRWWSGEFFPPTFTLPTENPISVESVVPTFAHGKAAIIGVMNTPWGNYDVAGDSVEMTMTGPDGEPVNPENLLATGVSRSVAHGGHYNPVNQTWLWSYQGSGAAPGQYDIEVSASNFQGSASASCSASLTLAEDDEGNLVPGETNPGQCGFASVSEEAIQEVAQNATDSANDS